MNMTTKAPKTLQDFFQKFWDEKVRWREMGDVTEDGDLAVRINGRHYLICDPKNTYPYLGFEGRPFIVRFKAGPHAGKTVHTNNLWCQGAIPEEYRTLLPDNAEFVWRW